MKIQVLSDLHIEFENFEINHSGADVIILAGDIHTGCRGIEWALNKIKNKPVIYVLGNHEYYGYAYPDLINQIKDLTDGTSVYLLENESITIGSVSFYGCTLWTDFNLFGTPELGRHRCQEKIPDFRKIELAPHYTKITPTDTAKLHAESLQWLERVYDEDNNQKNIIVTHHAPTAFSIPKQFKTNIMSSGFASNLDQLIERLSPRLWVHGHMHENCDYTIGSTQVICNPRGYPAENSAGFNPNLLIEI